MWAQSNEQKGLVACKEAQQQQHRQFAKGPLAFQEQNCHGCQREMSSPIVFPPVATSKPPLTWAQRDEASLIAPTAQNLDAAPASSMLQVGIHVMTSRPLLSKSAATNSGHAPAVCSVICPCPNLLHGQPYNIHAHHPLTDCLTRPSAFR